MDRIIQKNIIYFFFVLQKLYKSVRGILNKLTPQKFDTLTDQVLALPIDSIERLTGVVGLVFDKVSFAFYNNCSFII